MKTITVVQDYLNNNLKNNYIKGILNVFSDINNFKNDIK